MPENQEGQGTVQQFDPRVDQLAQQMQALREQNERIFAALERNNSPKETPLPEVSGTEFLDNPVSHVNSVVERQVTKLGEDLRKQMEPFAQYMVQNQRMQFVENVLAEMDSNTTTFKHIKNAFVRNIVKQALTAAPQVNQQFVYAVYKTAVGEAYESGKLTEQSNSNAPIVPAHLRPDGSSGTSDGAAGLPALDENQKLIARQRGWSHARACYMNQLITAEQYKKIEPNGKILMDF